MSYSLDQKTAPKTGGVRLLILDLLKLHYPSIISFTTALDQIDEIKTVNRS